MRHRVWITCLILAAPSGVIAGQTISELTAGASATVNGVVHLISDEDTFVLKDHTGRIPVYIGPNAMPVQKGMNVTVHGIVDDGLFSEIYASRVTDDQGRVTELPHRYE